jgi:hypothetical protein
MPSSDGRVVLLQPFLHRRNPEPRRLEEALDVLAGVDETLARSTPCSSISTAYGSLPTW